MVYNNSYQPSDFPNLMTDVFGTGLVQVIAYTGVIVFALILLILIRAAKR